MTRTGKIIIGLCLLFVQTSYGQIINPSFSRRDVTFCDIVKIEKTSFNTTVYFKYKAPSTYENGGWVCAGGNFFIRDVYSGTKYELKKANNIPICPSRHNFQYQGQVLEFSLVFEALPNSTTRIDIIEDEIERGFNFFGVNLNSTASNNTDTALSTTSPSNNFEECDKIIFIAPSNKPSFNEYLAGVKYAVFPGTAEYTSQNEAFSALKKYLYDMEFSEIIFGSGNDFNFSNNLCDYTLVILEWTNSVIQEDSRDISLKFISPCLNYEYSFKTTKANLADGGIATNTFAYFYNALVKMQNKTKPKYSPYYTLKLAQKQTCWTETKIKSFFQSKGCDRLEGIYENSGSSNSMAKDRVAVKKINGTYYLIYLSGAKYTENWTEGEIKATLEPTATPLFYNAKWIMADKSEDSSYYLTFEQGFFNLISYDNEKSLYIKMYPSSTDNIANSPSEGAISGTGYAISSDGFIVTNHHITNGASSIKIRGVNGDFSKVYTAKIIIEDKNNDLSIIKIDDPSFSTFGTIPYIIANRASDVGSSVFVLGYPLRATMGDEVKLTNGIISSKSGFQGDITSYQITAPVQPGNSGGPLFDERGNIIGIINAKHIGAENASYAIKASYLVNLIDLMPTPPKLQTISTVAGKPLTEQVKILKKFTYIIEIN